MKWGVSRRFFMKKQKEKQEQNEGERLTSFKALYAHERNNEYYKELSQINTERGSDQISLVNEAYMNEYEMYVHNSDIYAPIDYVYAPVTIISSNSVPTTSITTPKNVRSAISTSTLNVTNDTVIASTLNVLGNAGYALRKFTELFLRKVNMSVELIINRISVFHGRMSMDHNGSVSAYFMGDTYHSFSEVVRLPGYKLQREVSSDSELVQMGESGMRERSISVLLERLRTGHLGKDFWMKDENCMACFLCDRMFTAWRRRHHCRICGQIFCSQCTTKIPGTNFGHMEYLRVCNRCNRIVNEYEGMDVNGEDGPAFSERHWLRSVSQSPFKSNYFMNELFPKKQILGNPLFPKNEEILPCDSFDLSDSLSSMPFRPVTANDSDTSDTDENYLASSLEFSNIGSLSDVVTSSKRELISKKKTGHLLTKGDHFLSFSMKSFNPVSENFRKASNMLMTLPPSTKVDNSSLVHQDCSSLENERLTMVDFWRKGSLKINQYLKGKKNLNKKHEKSPISIEYSKDLEMFFKNTYSIQPFSNTSLKISQKLSLSDSFLKTVDINSFSLGYIRELLKQLLSDFNITSVSHWEPVLTPILFKIVDNINPNIRNGDDIDIRHYVKIKKILGGDPTLSCYVQGLVFTKKLALKKMNTSLVNPRVVLITFPIEYHRTESQFMSLDPVIAQEKEYLRNLVNRIIALHPTVLFVEKSVSGLAMQYLFESNIVVASNVKPSVIQAISRCTKADIISSIDKLALSPRVGKCVYFNLRSFVNPEIPNTKKTFIFLEGCPKDLGCTIILRGSTFQELSFIKQIVELMVYSVYNLKLEMCLIRDQFILLPDMPSSTFISDYSEDSLSTENDDVFTTSYDPIIKIFEARLISSSPYVKFPLPHMLLKVRESEKYLKILLAGGETDALSQRVHNFLKEISVSDTDHLLLDIDSEKVLRNAEIEKVQQEFKIQEKNWKSYFVQDVGVANPFFHQGFAVLYSSVCTASAIPCKGPVMNVIEYYRETDCTLGQYIEDMCLTANIICNVNLCGKRLFEHHRCYVHDHARITVVIQELKHPVIEMQKAILVWSYCKNCKKNTPMIPMSDNSWKYSFGKYLELAFYNIAFRSRSFACSHDINKDHIRYFGYQNFVVKFQFDYIELYGLSLPQAEIIWRPEEWIRIKLEEYNSIKSKIEKFCDSVEIRLNSITLEAIPLSKFEACKLEIEHFKKKIKDDRVFLLNLLKDSFENSHPLKILPLNRVLRNMQEIVAQWDFDFNEFDKDFFLSEKDLRKFTSLHLKKFFMDRDFISDQSYSKGIKMGFCESNLSLSSKENLDTNIFDVKKDVQKSLDQKSNMVFIENACHGSDDKLDKTQEFLDISDKLVEKLENPYDKTRKNISIKNKAIDIENKVFFDNSSNMSQKLNIENGSSTFPVMSFRSFPFKNSFFRRNFLRILRLDQRLSTYNFKKDNIFHDMSKLKNTNFQHTFKHKRKLDENFRSRTRGNFSENNLSNFSNDFEQFNRELEKQQTRKQRLKFKKNYAFPPSSSRPIVEVFQNVQEAVDETSDDEILIHEQKKISKNLKRRNKNEFDLNKKGKRKMRRSRTIDSFNLYGNRMDLENSDRDSDLSSLEIFYTSAECFKFSNDDIVDEIPRHGVERISLMKALFAFWADRAAVGWSPLSYPLNSSEHVFTDSDVIVREEEPSSLIAFTLSSADYLDKLKEMEHIKVLHNILGNLKTEEKPKDLRTLGKKPLEDALLKPTGTHLKYQFQEGSARLFCKVFYAEQFDAFRRVCNCDENYLSSLSRCFKWDSSGGKSGSAFLKTRDERLVLKQLSRLETEAFIKFAPSYFEYMSQAFFHELPTVMAKIIGFYQIGSRNPHTGKVTKMDVLVTENLFYGRKTSRIFDLKGSMRNRHVQSTGKENEVLLDENLVEFIYNSPLFIREHYKKILRASLWNDTLFLAKMNVMDYSMVVGIDDEKQELIVGIIESWVKEKGLVGGGGKEPTVVTPRQYKNRFREAMDSYIYGSPSCWYLFESALGLRV
ncbi:hypothetical protein PCANB_001042 [Pneumocystis canis]|nr:hypothetical protein PCANB_001042 [Pneumocystis canis]